MPWESKRSSARLQGGTPESPISFEEDDEPQPKRRSFRAQAKRRRPAQYEHEDSPPAKRALRSTTPFNSSLKPEIRTLRTPASIINELSMEGSKMHPTAQEFDCESNRSLEYFAPMDGSITDESAEDPQTRPPLVISDSVNPVSAARLSKGTGRKVTFAQVPYREQARRMSSWFLYFQWTDQVNSSPDANRSGQNPAIQDKRPQSDHRNLRPAPRTRIPGLTEQ